MRRALAVSLSDTFRSRGFTFRRGGKVLTVESYFVTMVQINGNIEATTPLSVQLKLYSQFMIYEFL